MRLLVQLVLEMAERPAPSDAASQPALRLLVTDPLSGIRHVLVPDVRWQRIDTDQIRVQVIKINGVLAVDATVDGPSVRAGRSGKC